MKIILSFAFCFLIVLRLVAHDTWLQATQTTVAVGEGVTLQLTSGNGFKGGDSGPQASRVIKSFVRVAGQPLPLLTGERTETFLTFSAKPTASGIAGFAVELKPRELELKPELIEEYFAEIHASAELRTAWDEVPAPRRWRERYTKSATTFVRVGTPQAEDRTWLQPAGVLLEILPQRDPTQLKVGDTLNVQLLLQGQPLPGLPVGFVSDGELSQQVVTSDAKGYAEATLDRAGRWLVRVTHLKRSTEKDLEWESHFSTLVVDVGGGG